MKPPADTDLIVAALLCPPPAGQAAWTARLLSAATGVPFMRVRSAISRLRFAGKIEFGSLSLSPSMLGAVAPHPGDACEGEAAVSEAGSAGDVLPAEMTGHAPRGHELLAEIDAAAARAGIPADVFIKPLVSPANTVASFRDQLLTATRPRDYTVERVRALCAGRPIPPLPDGQKIARPRRHVEPNGGIPGSMRSERAASALGAAAAEADVIAERRAETEARDAAREKEAERVARDEALLRAPLPPITLNKRFTQPTALSSIPIERVRALSVRDAMQVALVDTPEDATVALRRRWPDLLDEIVTLHRARGEPFAKTFGEVIETGLAACQASEREAA